MEGKETTKDAATALKRAKEIKVLAGEKLGKAAEELRAMVQFPGLEEEVARKKEEMLKLYRDAEQTWEGKKYADVMRRAFEELKTNPSAKVVDVNWNREDVDDFIKFLEAKFGSQLVDPAHRLGGYVPAVSYLPIKGTSFVFILMLRNWPQIITLKKADQNFISALVKPEKPGKGK